MSARILLAEDDAGVREVVGYALEREGFAVTPVEDAAGALAHAREEEYDVVVLDVMLPDGSGFDVCRALRAESSVPIIMLTAKDAEIDRVLGLELGADDYVTKPFSSAELVSRLRSILRRRELDRSEAGGAPLEVGGLRVDLTGHEVSVEGEPVAVTPSELRILALLASEPGRVVSRREIMQHLWQTDFVGDEHACEVHVSNLRRKVEADPANPRRILTVRGAGYKLAAS